MSPDKFSAELIMGAVLAGGLSRRMGTDKTTLELAGRPLVTWNLAKLVEVFESTVVVAPLKPAFESLGVEVLPDRTPGCGPLGGIETALHRAAGRDVFIIACDMPFVPKEIIRYLVNLFFDVRRARSKGSPTAVVPLSDDRFQPLCAAYSSECLPSVRQALWSRNWSVSEWVDSIGAEKVEVQKGLDSDVSRLFLNVNETSDWTMAQRFIAESKGSL